MTALGNNYHHEKAWIRPARRMATHCDRAFFGVFFLPKIVSRQNSLKVLVFGKASKQSPPRPLDLDGTGWDKKLFAMLRCHADLKKSSVQILVGIRLVRHHREILKVFNFHCLRQLVGRF